MWDALLYANNLGLSFLSWKPKDEKSTQVDEEVIDQNALALRNLLSLIPDIFLCRNEPETWEGKNEWAKALY